MKTITPNHLAPSLRNTFSAAMAISLSLLAAGCAQTPAARVPPANTAKITVTARMTDGSKLGDAKCSIYPDVGLLAQGATPDALQSPQPIPKVVGSNGDWVVENMPLGDWQISVANPNSAEGVMMQRVRLDHGGNCSVSFVFSRGVALKGRVLDADTGRPVAEASVYDAEYADPRENTDAAIIDVVRNLYLNTNVFIVSDGSQTHTDSNGRFEIEHARHSTNGLAAYFVQTTNFVGQRITVAGTSEGATIAVPDVRLHQGGWISGRVVLPADAPTSASANMQSPIVESGAKSPDLIYPDPAMSGDGTFRVGPLPPGTYGLKARAGMGKSSNLWHAEGEVTGIKVEAGQEIAGIIIQAKTASASSH